MQTFPKETGMMSFLSGKRGAKWQPRIYSGKLNQKMGVHLPTRIPKDFNAQGFNSSEDENEKGMITNKD